MTEAARTLAAVERVLRSADLLEERRGSGDVAVLGVTQDSRAVESGDLFLAWKGTGLDAHDFVSAAVQSGAVATVVERPVEVDIPQLVVSNGRRAAALAAEAVMGFPSLDMVTVGVTGTNGKTTTALLIGHLLSPDVKTAVIGTLGLVETGGIRAGTEGLTTPGPVQVAIWLRELADGGTGAVVMEASSHALEQHRLDGVRFDIGIFTNLSQDHLDYHGDLASYRDAKARLVELVVPDGTVVVNGADPAWASLELGARTRRTFAIESGANVCARDLALGHRGTSFSLEVDGSHHSVQMPLVGRYNVENALAAVSAALAAGVPIEQIVSRLATAPQVRGRLEAVVSDPFTVLIDFAHTPAALDGALAAIRPLTTGRLIVLFGAGGDRDRAKRRPMAEAVRNAADIVVLTSDNPRTEDPEAILDDLAEGLGDTHYERIADRRQAIRAALEIARPGDTVVLAGKGHERYQVVGHERRPFDERAIVLDALRELGIS
ncbi:MAG: UDP-N-acetylmuramoyl-L-alanyl-D-glutamate--2,6-diaminopimelate ligase [Gemmatimonadetes bacterium]|nr:UDP-N-acetylmuramoyl-L-alanyl-D-glutamate--2,6-diaminopimelate ligase [Gemmatimonadota bacterium]MDA1102815.1 UDP-N-acetylmuramoyl-L-alanyl-D-glutamate--2,6-diaminopimelate ligase [Gemmatimonadota bacterium]